MNRENVLKMSSAVGVAAAVMLTDQLSKSFAERVGCGDMICPLTNTELMLGAGDRSMAPAVLGALGLGVFTLYAGRLVRRGRIGAWVMGLVVGGIASNLADRLWIGAVRDFLAGPANTLLNLADLAILVGLAITVIAALDLGRAPGAPNDSRGGEVQ